MEALRKHMKKRSTGYFGVMIQTLSLLTGIASLIGYKRQTATESTGLLVGTAIYAIWYLAWCLLTFSHRETWLWQVYAHEISIQSPVREYLAESVVRGPSCHKIWVLLLEFRHRYADVKKGLASNRIIPSASPRPLFHCQVVSPTLGAVRRFRRRKRAYDLARTSACI